MKYKHLMNVTTVIALLAGVAFICYRVWIMSFYNLAPFYHLAPASDAVLVTKDSPIMVVFTALSFMRMFGVMLLGVGILAFVTRNITNLEAQRAITLALFLGNSLAFLMALLQQIAIWNRGTGQVTVGMFLMLAIGFGYFRFLKLNAPGESQV